MELKKWFCVGFLSCLILMGCAGFSYHYYGMKDVVYDHGQLLGPTEKEDMPFSKCAPNAQSKHPCVVMLIKDFYDLKLDYEDTKQKLKTCEKK
jgi:hypothetical protein